MDRVVPAVCRADRPRAAGIGRARGRRVVRPLAELVPDRVDRRQVDDVEPHRRDTRQPLRGGAESARLPGAVSSPSSRPRSAGRTRTRRRRPRRRARPAAGASRSWSRARCRGAAAMADARRASCATFMRAAGVSLRSSSAVRAWAKIAEADRSRSSRAHREDELDILARLDLDVGGVQPRRPVVGRRSDAERPDAGAGDRHLGEPPVGARADQPHPVPRLVPVGIGEQHLGEQLAVALAEDRRLEGHHFADERFRRPPILGLARGDRRGWGSARCAECAEWPRSRRYRLGGARKGRAPRSRRGFGGGPAKWRTGGVQRPLYPISNWSDLWERSHVSTKRPDQSAVINWTAPVGWAPGVGHGVPFVRTMGDRNVVCGGNTTYPGVDQPRWRTTRTPPTSNTGSVTLIPTVVDRRASRDAAKGPTK